MSNESKRVLIAGLFHETHTFLEGRTRLEDFSTLQGEEFKSALGDASPLAGAVECATQFGWEMIPAIDMRAVPGPMVDAEVLDYWWERCEPVVRDAAKAGLDGIFLVLHGAMVSEGCLDVEGEILERIRNIVGPDILIAGVTDLHSNFTGKMAANSNVLITYRENPHTDAKEASMRAAHLLQCLMYEESPAVTSFKQMPIAWPPTGTGTADSPMKALEALAREIEETNPAVMAVNVHAGYSFADIPDTGVSFTVITSAAEKAVEPLERLEELALELKEQGNKVEPALQDIMPQVVELLANGQGGGPIIIVEPSDNIGGGAPGDDTAVLQALLQHDISGAAVVIDDAAAVQIVSALQAGESTKISLGGKGSRLNSGPLEIEVELVSTSNGKFTLEDPRSHLASMSGLHIEMGNCAVVQAKGVKILITSLKTPPFDLGQLRSQGIIPEECSVIGVKAAVAHRQAYDPITRVSFTVNTPGPCGSNLKLLPFQNIRRPVYPLD